MRPLNWFGLGCVDVMYEDVAVPISIGPVAKVNLFLRNVSAERSWLSSARLAGLTVVLNSFCQCSDTS